MTIGDETVLELVISLHRLTRSLRRSATAGSIQLTHISVLALLSQRGPSRIGEIAQWVPCSQPTATAAVLGLESAGLVRREADPDDRRASRVLVTEQGIAALADVARGEAQVLARRLAALRPEEARRLAAVEPLLRRLAEAGD
ncbi:MarR family transcriptional regulator [Streptomyces sp. NRRL F-4489]|uniref:MarR family winged helix-turn-helix transcriptional regulator n=1 Tax=Streptomyces sp. NRRL F-4489 TaxID=1609095 RepID=UPI00074A886D|nr:MarR family transcriptional regulator [Streptomyces sp. NRRL F-4489]KUL38462.1 MarR family transcriptional regulator [Streptomyces sp. NRRL F-4489]